MTASLPTSFMISAQIRIAAQSGIPITVLRRGHDASGTILLKINRLDGTAQVLSQVRYGDELVWSPAAAAMSEKEADEYLEQQAQFDPDSWLLEVEDKQGRPWFPGKVVEA